MSSTKIDSNGITKLFTVSVLLLCGPTPLDRMPIPKDSAFLWNSYKISSRTSSADSPRVTGSIIGRMTPSRRNQCSTWVHWEQCYVKILHQLIFLSRSDSFARRHG